MSARQPRRRASRALCLSCSKVNNLGSFSCIQAAHGVWHVIVASFFVIASSKWHSSKTRFLRIDKPAAPKGASTRHGATPKTPHSLLIPRFLKKKIWLYLRYACVQSWRPICCLTASNHDDLMTAQTLPWARRVQARQRAAAVTCSYSCAHSLPRLRALKQSLHQSVHVHLT